MQPCKKMPHLVEVVGYVSQRATDWRQHLQLQLQHLQLQFQHLQLQKAAKPENKFTYTPVSYAEISKTINQLKHKTSSGNDEISNVTLKNIEAYIDKPLSTYLLTVLKDEPFYIEGVRKKSRMG